MTAEIRIGCAGWNVPAAAGQFFPADGSHLERYASVFNCVEINSSFYRAHRPATYARWRDSVPERFRFSVKLPRSITHQARLVACDALLQAFAQEAGALQHKLGCILVQLPPSLQFDQPVAAHFFDRLRRWLAAPVVCEPRHPSWATGAAVALMEQAGVSYVRADPVVVAPAASLEPQVRYHRLHGAPVIYRSDYAPSCLDALAASLLQARREERTAWCVFDNTAEGAAVPDALSLLSRIKPAA